MSKFLKPIANLLPLTYLGDIPRYVMVGPPNTGFRTALAVLAGWFVVTLVLGVGFLNGSMGKV